LIGKEGIERDDDEEEGREEEVLSLSLFLYKHPRIPNEKERTYSVLQTASPTSTNFSKRAILQRDPLRGEGELRWVSSRESSAIRSSPSLRARFQARWLGDLKMEEEEHLLQGERERKRTWEGEGEGEGGSWQGREGKPRSSVTRSLPLRALRIRFGSSR